MSEDAPQLLPAAPLLLCQEIINAEPPRLLLCQELLDADAEPNEVVAPYPASADILPYPVDVEPMEIDFSSSSDEDSDVEPALLASNALEVSKSSAGVLNWAQELFCSSSTPAEHHTESHLLSTFTPAPKIYKKPKGQASDDWSFEGAMSDCGWDSNIFSEVKKYTAKLVNRYMDGTHCLTKQGAQGPLIVQRIIDEVDLQFPKLRLKSSFPLGWPIREMIRLDLKASSQAARKAAKAASSEVPVKQGKKGKARAAELKKKKIRDSYHQRRKTFYTASTRIDTLLK